jgi:hypothetical protein
VGDAGMGVGWSTLAVGLGCTGFFVGCDVAVTGFVIVGMDVFFQNNASGVFAGRVIVGRGVPDVLIFPTAVRVENKITTMDSSTSEIDTKILMIIAIERVAADRLERWCNGYPHSGKTGIWMIEISSIEIIISDIW